MRLLMSAPPLQRKAKERVAIGDRGRSDVPVSSDVAIWGGGLAGASSAAPSRILRDRRSTPRATATGGYGNRGRRGTTIPTLEPEGGVIWDPISSPECEHRSTRSLIAPFDGEWGGRNHKRVRAARSRGG